GSWVAWSTISARNFPCQAIDSGQVPVGIGLACPSRRSWPPDDTSCTAWGPPHAHPRHAAPRADGGGHPPVTRRVTVGSAVGGSRRARGLAHDEPEPAR